MNIEKKLDEICDKLETTPLSAILLLLLPIALEFEDYSGYCILTFWSNNFCRDKKVINMLRKRIKEALVLEGLTEERAEEIIKDEIEYYIALRSIDDNRCMVYSAKEMENRFKMLDDTINELTPPQGLHPTDLYFYSTNSNNMKSSIRQERTTLEKQYDSLHSYITGKISEYMQKNRIRERKKVLEKKIVNSKNIFIIHGHNEAKRRELENLLKERFKLNPIILSEQPDQGLTIIEKFEKYASNCSYAFALFTPDDIVINGDKEYFQARPNVIFELGWFYANLGRSRVCVLDQESAKSRIFSDLQGVMRMQFINNISEKYVEIERELKSVGIIE